MSNGATPALWPLYVMFTVTIAITAAAVVVRISWWLQRRRRLRALRRLRAIA